MKKKVMVGQHSIYCVETTRETILMEIITSFIERGADLKASNTNNGITALDLFKNFSPFKHGSKPKIVKLSMGAEHF